MSRVSLDGLPASTEGGGERDCSCYAANGEVEICVPGQLIPREDCEWTTESGRRGRNVEGEGYSREGQDADEVQVMR